MGHSFGKWLSKGGVPVRRRRPVIEDAVEGLEMRQVLSACGVQNSLAEVATSPSSGSAEPRLLAEQFAGRYVFDERQPGTPQGPFGEFERLSVSVKGRKTLVSVFVEGTGVPREHPPVYRFKLKGPTASESEVVLRGQGLARKYDLRLTALAFEDQSTQGETPLVNRAAVDLLRGNVVSTAIANRTGV